MNNKLLSLVLVFLLAGCGADEKPKAPETQPVQAASETPPKIEYPEEMIGKWAAGAGNNACKNAAKSEKLTDRWTGIVINKDETWNEMIHCSPTALTNNESGFTTSENCDSEGNEWKTTATYSISGETLKIAYDDGKGGKSTQMFTNCKAPVVKICTIKKDHAGVGTFKDEQLKKQGTFPMNANQAWSFKSSKQIEVNGQKVLVGQLCNAFDCSPQDVVEKKSFALAEEWDCK